MMNVATLIDLMAWFEIVSTDKRGAVMFRVNIMAVKL